MTKIYTLFCLFFCLSFHSYAQENSSTQLKTLKKFNLVQFNIGLGLDWNRFNSMSHRELMVFAEDPQRMQRDLQGLTEEATPTTAGGSIYVSFSFSPLNRSKGTYRNNQEIRFGVVLYSPKEAMVSFKNETLDTSIVFCNIHGELALEAAYVWKGKWGKRKRLNWHVGGGLNTGFTFDNQMVLMSGKYFEPGQHPTMQEGGMEEARFEAKSVFYTRFYIPYGLHYQISENWQLGLDLRTGFGLQIIEDEKVNVMRRTGAFVLGAKYVL